MNRTVLMVEEEMEGERLDAYIAEKIEKMSRSQVKGLIEDGKVMVNNEMKKASYRIQEGEEIIVEVPMPQPVELVPQSLPLEIIYQDQDVAVINKAKGMVVHPAHGNWDHTLVNALLYHITDLSGINGELRPGIVHRLDKDTSGVMVVAKNDLAHRNLVSQIKEHTVNRAYKALVHGVIKENLGSIEAPIGRSKTDRKKMAVVANGRPATSNYQVLKRYRDYTYVRVQLMTGRTHQIRVHFAYIRHPVVGDPLYGPAKKHLGAESQVLHAFLLGFKHPRSGEYLEFISEPPDSFESVLNELNRTQ